MLNNKKTVTDQNILKLEKEWPRRLAGSLVVLLFIWLAGGIILILRNDLIEKQIDDFKSELYDWWGTKGFILDDVVISGRNRTAKEDILQVLGIERGANMLKIDVYAIKEKLEALPWVKEAVVRRSFFPNLLNIELVEKQVRAIWQINEQFYPLDDEGKIIKAEFKIVEPILLIVGAGAPENFKNLTEALKDEDANYISRVKVANYISGRRWNLILDDIRNGITIKLPEENIAQAWKKLAKLDKTKGIFKRKLTIIDLRLPDKIVVKLRKGNSAEVKNLTETVEHNL